MSLTLCIAIHSCAHVYSYPFSHFNKHFSIWTEFIPQVIIISVNYYVLLSVFIKLIFIISIFGYMVLLILIKWCIPYASNGTVSKVLVNYTHKWFVNSSLYHRLQIYLPPLLICSLPHVKIQQHLRTPLGLCCSA